MKKTTQLHLLLAILLIVSSQTFISAQELMFEVPLQTQVQASSQIIEGQVISKTSFWDDNQQNIYTINTVEVYKVFKGQTTSTLVEIVTPGGTVGLESEVVTPSLTLNIGDTGVFMLHANNVALSQGTTSNKLMPFASSQGFYQYDLKNNIVRNPFQTQQGITTEFYSAIQSLTNNAAITEISDFDVDTVYENLSANRDSNGAVFISSFSPTTVNGGVKDLLVVDGGGFGTSGTIAFRDANFGGVDNMFNPVYYDALDSQIVSWTDSQIVVEVPSRAGTGDIRVTPDIGGEVISAQTLTVFYSQINPSSGTVDFPSQHFDTNGNGGYTWQMNTEFNGNAAANASFLRAFDTWVCTTGINWEIGSVTPIDVIAADGVNIIRFDNGTELPQGVLGRCTSRFGSCASGSPGGIDVVVTELDIVFNDVFTGDFAVLSWEFGPDTATGFEVDFESVAVHELGHGHQLAHIINVGEVMHYSIANSQNSRDLGASDIAGGTDVMNRNVANQVCAQDLMTYSACSGLTLSLDEATIETHISIYPNPTKGTLHISNATNMIIDNVSIYDMRGRLVLSNKPSSNSLNSLDVSQLNAGMYFIEFQMENIAISKKFIKE
ncbi:MAG: T9SS type A sorting domain-containing protein [Algicola sp.]|nr:T9SS type A sorting domain-containing protein [Algicola sp.]